MKLYETEQEQQELLNRLKASSDYRDQVKYQALIEIHAAMGNYFNRYFAGRITSTEVTIVMDEAIDAVSSVLASMVVCVAEGKSDRAKLCDGTVRRLADNIWGMVHASMHRNPGLVRVVDHGPN